MRKHSRFQVPIVFTYVVFQIKLKSCLE